MTILQGWVSCYEAASPSFPQLGAPPRMKKTPSRTSSWQAALGWALGRWANRDACSLARVGRQALEVCSPSRSCLWKYFWKRRWDGNRIKMPDVPGKYPRWERPGAELPARTTSPGKWWSLHHWRLLRRNRVLDNLIRAPFVTKGWTR